MLIYVGTKHQFMEDIEKDIIFENIKKTIYDKMRMTPSENEIHSWNNSLKNMYIAINDKLIPDNSGIAIEYNIPQTAKRVDFMISGYGTDSDQNVVIIELKQWESINEIKDSETLVETYLAKAIRKVVHPSYQVWSYSELIKDYNVNVQNENIILHPCVFMHNYNRTKDDPIDASQYRLYTDCAPVFTSGQNGDLRGFINKHISKGDDNSILRKIDNGKIKPSKSLQDSIGKMINGSKEFVLIDEQQVAFEEIFKISSNCFKNAKTKKHTIICKGGPGTGKSIIAIRLLAELTRNDQFVQYVSKNSAPRIVYAAKLKGKCKKSSIDNMFKSSGSYVNSSCNSIDTLIVDEAHRLNQKSGLFMNLGENQIKEIIHAAKCSVFFIDESQRVTIKVIGSVEEIKKWALSEGSEITELELISQFRCNGSNGYLSWLDNILEIRSTANFNLDGIDFDFRICNTPEELYTLVLEKNSINNKSRLLAGYCWDWPQKTRSNTNYNDIKIGNFGISWNLDGGEAYALRESSVNEAGCIHTTQGLEFDYVGVIIGDDLRYEDGHIVTDFTKRAKTDNSLKGIKTILKKDPKQALSIADEIIKNTYRTLMTRGMKGCYIYCTDNNLKDYFQRCLH